MNTINLLWLHTVIGLEKNGRKKQNHLKNKTKTNRKILQNSVLCLQLK